EVVGAGRGRVLHVRPDQGPEDAHRRHGADRRDPVDGTYRRFRRLQARDDLAVGDPGLRPRAPVAERRAIGDRGEVVVETVFGVLARADVLEYLPVEDLEAERDAVDPHRAQRVVAPQVAMGRGLDPDEQPELLLDARDVGFQDVQVRVARVVAGVEVHVGDAGFVAGGANDLHHLGHRLLVRVVRAEIESDRAELAVGLARLDRPVVADLGRVDAEVGALQRPHPRHRLAGRSEAVVPGGPRREADAHDLRL